MQNYQQLTSDTHIRLQLRQRARLFRLPFTLRKATQDCRNRAIAAPRGLEIEEAFCSSQESHLTANCIVRLKKNSDASMVIYATTAQKLRQSILFKMQCLPLVAIARFCTTSVTHQVRPQNVLPECTESLHTFSLAQPQLSVGSSFIVNHCNGIIPLLPTILWEAVLPSPLGQPR